MVRLARKIYFQTSFVAANVNTANATGACLVTTANDDFSLVENLRLVGGLQAVDVPVSSYGDIRFHFMGPKFQLADMNRGP